MNKRQELELLEEIAALQREKDIRAARKSFYSYCQVKAPDFYKSDRAFLRQLCNEMQSFLTSDDEVLIINAPPRHGKSRTVGNLCEWILGNNQQSKIMTGSYNETLSTMFSKNVRNSIMEEKADKDKIIFSDIFPDVRIKKGDAAMNMWSLENGYNNYLATSPTGTATGFGATLMIIDDLIKSSYEANNARILQEHWDWFINTMMSRLEEGAKIIIIMTRWATTDLAGRALEHFTNIGKKVKHLSFKAQQDDGTMLCPEILSLKTYEDKVKTMSADIASANYQQVPIDIKGRLYTKFKTYEQLPKDKDGNLLFREIKNYTDTADTGSDYLCSICYGVYNGDAYILDILYTKEPMEITEPATAKMLNDCKVNIADIESNNGGRGFARNVQREIKEKYPSCHCVVNWFYQSKNKVARIISNSAFAMEHIFYPLNWKEKYPDFYKAMATYQKEGKNLHDDAPDTITGIAEQIGGFDDWVY